MPEGSIGAEIGVHEGDFSARIISDVSPQKLHLIDPWEHFDGSEYDRAWYGGHDVSQSEMDRRFEHVKQRFDSNIERGQVKIHRVPSDEAVSDFEDAYLDWVYIDGNHLYDYILQDLQLYEPKVKPGGALMGDDYGVEGWWDNGVQEAVDDFVAERDLPLRVYGDQFIIEK